MKESKVHTHSISEGQLKFLLKFAAQDQPCHLINLMKTIDATISQVTNFQKWQYWDVVEKVKKGSGLWRITRIGYEFLANKRKLHQRVQSYDNKFYGYPDDKMISVTDKIQDFNYKKLPEYIRDMFVPGKVEQGDLFDE